MVENLRLGLIIYGSLDTLSGGYLYDRKLVSHLCEQGDEVEIISLPWRNYVRHLADNRSSILLERLQRLSLDLLLQDELNHPSLFWINQRLRESVSYPIVSIVHHLRSSEARPAWQNRFYRWVERRYLSSVDGFIFNSQTTHQAVKDCLGAQKPLRSHIVAYPGGDRLAPGLSDAQILQRAEAPGPMQLLFLGNIIPRKGLHTLLRALGRLPEEPDGASWRLNVVGSLGADPSYVHKMRCLADRLGIREKVRFMGALHDRALYEQLSGNHVLVVPSTYEGFGIVYLEGMGFGLPAIASSGGAAAEIITSEKNGFIIPPGDEVILAQRIHELIHNRRCLQNMSLAARRHFQTQPTWASSMDLIHGFLHSLIESTYQELKLVS